MGSAGGIYIGIYSIYYLVTEMHVNDLSNDAIYLLYANVFVGMYACAAGAISVQASYSFVSYMYKNLRME